MGLILSDTLYLGTATPGGGGSSLPDQTGNSGKFLTTDGTDASWSDKPLVNTATGWASLTIGGNVAYNGRATNVGDGSTASGGYCSSFGNSASASGQNSTAVGAYSSATNRYAAAIGSDALAKQNGSIQIGKGTNNDTGTLKVGLVYDVNGNGNNYELLSMNGTIPADRLPNAINKYSTMPTAASTNEGWIVQYTGTTDANYTHGYIYECVSDGGNPATYSWSAVSVQAGGGSSLPSQTGNSGKFLTTDGTDPSWATISALQNTATGGGSLTINGTASSASYAINIGGGSQAGGSYAVATGNSAQAKGTADVAYGSQAATSANKTLQIAIGYNARTTASYAIQIGPGTNSATGTMSVALSADGNTWGNYELLSSNGTVPHARLTNAVVSNSITIAVADWNGGTTCSKTVSGLTATSVVWVAPDSASQSDYLTAGVYASNQTTDTLTFTCTTTPTSALTVNVIYC